MLLRQLRSTTLASADGESAGALVSRAVSVFRKRARRPTCQLRAFLGAPGADGGAFGLIPKLDVAGSSPVARSVRSICKTLILNLFWAPVAETRSASFALVPVAVTDPVAGVLPCCSASRAESNGG